MSAPPPCALRVTRPVLWGELDALGHVNNTVFFRYFEEARIALLDAVGLRAQRDASRVGPILAATSCQFRAPLTHPDTVTCAVWVRQIGTTSFTLDYALHSAAQGLVATGDSVVVNFDYTAGHKRPLAGAVKDALARLTP